MFIGIFSDLSNNLKLLYIDAPEIRIAQFLNVHNNTGSFCRCHVCKHNSKKYFFQNAVKKKNKLDPEADCFLLVK